jgi:hypothetical protein
MSPASLLARATFDATLDVLRSDPAARDELAAVLAPHLWKHLEAQTNTPREDGWLDSRRAASQIGLTINALHKHTAARTIPFEQEGPGCKLWFRRTALDAWREACTAQSRRPTRSGPAVLP